MLSRDIDEGVSVLETDQLGWLMQKGTVFRGFKEHRITFRPTYKSAPTQHRGFGLKLD